MEYKILLIKNRFKERIDFSYGIKHMQEKTPLKLVIDEIDTDIDLRFIEIGNGSFKGGVPSNTQDFKKFVKEGKYNAVVLVYGNDCPYLRVSTVENIPLYRDTEFITCHSTYDTGMIFNHELFHAFFKKLGRYGIYLNDPMDTYENDQNLYAPVSNRTKAIALLSLYWEKVCAFNQKPNETPSMPTYKYFKSSEIVGLKSELVKLLDEARHIAGIPFKLNSGYRTKEQNKKAGGVKDSSHTKGIGCDISATTSSQRFRIIDSALKVGFTRIGIYPKHIHLDIGKYPDYSEKVVWLSEND